MVKENTEPHKNNIVIIEDNPIGTNQILLMNIMTATYQKNVFICRYNGIHQWVT